jgi:hypothetical protein
LPRNRLVNWCRLWETRRLDFIIRAGSLYIIIKIVINRLVCVGGVNQRRDFVDFDRYILHLASHQQQSSIYSAMHWRDHLHQKLHSGSASRSQQIASTRVTYHAAK